MPRIKKSTIPIFSSLIQTGEKFGLKIGDKVKINNEKHDRLFPDDVDTRYSAPIDNLIGIVVGFPKSEITKCVTVYFKGLDYYGINGYETYTIHHAVWDKI